MALHAHPMTEGRDCASTGFLVAHGTISSDHRRTNAPFGQNRRRRAFQRDAAVDDNLDPGHVPRVELGHAARPSWL